VPRDDRGHRPQVSKQVSKVTDTKTGFAPINGAQLYYETAGEGPPFVMIHAGVADNRQWNNEFAHYAKRHRVVRYDMRGYGRSEPVVGDFTHLADLEGLLAHLRIERPMILMGCSMGGGLAMNYALAHPSDVAALIMVGSGPSGLALDVPMDPRFAEVQRAVEARDVERVVELEVQIWFDGVGRRPDQVDPTMRALAYDMGHIAVLHAAKELGTRKPDSDSPAAERLGELSQPVAVIVGEHDTEYLQAAAAYMVERLPTVEKVLMKRAAHLPNMDDPAEFARIVDAFLARHVGRIPAR
jgi:pimeloyl-ACP methyl ester carboxylesterase